MALSDVADDRARPVPRSLLRNRSYQALWCGEAAAGLGEQAASVAYPFLILAITGSAGYAGAVGSAQLLAQGLMSFWGGVLADRMDRKRLLLGCAVIRMALLALFATLLLAGMANMVITFAVAITSSCCFGLSMPAGMAMVKQVVRPEQVAQATTQNQVRWFGAITAGPSIGGALYGAARVLPFYGACLSYLLSAVATLFVGRIPRAETPRAGRGSLLEGFRYLVRDRVLCPLMISVTLSNLAFNTTSISLAIIASGRARGASSSLTGLAISIAGAGAVIGALAAGSVIKRMRPSAIFISGYWIAPLAAVLLAFVPGVLPLGIIVACVYVRGPVINSLFLTYVAKTIPESLQGRVLGVILFVSTIVSPLGVLAVGLIFEFFHPFEVFIVIAAVAAIAALPTLSKGIRGLGSLEDLNPQPAEREPA